MSYKLDKEGLLQEPLYRNLLILVVIVGLFLFGIGFFIIKDMKQHKLSSATRETTGTGKMLAYEVFCEAGVVCFYSKEAGVSCMSKGEVSDRFFKKYCGY